MADLCIPCTLAFVPRPSTWRQRKIYHIPSPKPSILRNAVALRCLARGTWQRPVSRRPSVCILLLGDKDFLKGISAEANRAGSSEIDRPRLPSTSMLLPSNCMVLTFNRRARATRILLRYCGDRPAVAVNRRWWECGESIPSRPDRKPFGLPSPPSSLTYCSSETSCRNSAQSTCEHVRRRLGPERTMVGCSPTMASEPRVHASGTISSRLETVLGSDQLEPNVL